MGCSESQSHGSRALVQQPATLPSPSEGTSSKLGLPMNLSVPLFLLSTKLLMSFYYYFLMETGPLSFNSLEYQERVWSFFFLMVYFLLILCLFPCLHLLSFSRRPFLVSAQSMAPTPSCVAAVTFSSAERLSHFLSVQLQFHPRKEGHFGNEVSTGFFEC